jgi:anti-anti-sigma factor
MTPIGSCSFRVPDRARLGWDGRETGPVVVWLRGDHDLSTDDALCATLARAIALDSASLVLDLSEVDFMAASTLGVIMRAREFLLQRSRSLTVRAPSAPVRRVVAACGLDDLLGPGPEKPSDKKNNALGTWVEVPPARRDDAQAAPSGRVAEHVAVRARPTFDLRAWPVGVAGPAERG